MQPGCIESTFGVLLLDEVLDCDGLLLLKRLRGGLDISEQRLLEVLTPGRRRKVTSSFYDQIMW